MLVMWGLAVGASAGTVTIEKDTGMVPAFAWVDGQAMGKLKGKKPLEVQVPDRAVEVWIAVDSGAMVTLCQGLVDGAASARVVANVAGCEGLRPGFGEHGTAHKGSRVNITAAAGVAAWLSLDGGQPLALPGVPLWLNLKPGPHTVTLSSDPLGTLAFHRGKFVAPAEGALNVNCSPTGCSGWDAAPQASPHSAAPTEASGHCCVNGAYHACPSAAAVEQCVGDPVDPSGCAPEPARDGECAG